MLYAGSAGALIAAVLVSAFPQVGEHAATATGWFVARFWQGLMLAAVAALIAVTAATSGRGTDPQRRRTALPLPLLVHVALLLGLAAAVAVGVGALLWAGVGRPALTSTRPAPAISPVPGAPTASASAVGMPAPSVTAAPVSAAPDTPGAWTVTNTFDAMKIILAVVGGIGGVVALTMAYRRQHLGEAAEHREEAKERRENTKLLNERFAKAAELVGSDKAAVRLAGVYAVAAAAT